MAVAYVISMKGGMSSFNRDELLELERRGIPFAIYATTSQPGSYMPESRWVVRAPCAWISLLGLADFLFRNPQGLALAVVEAARHRVWIEFLVALGFASDMRRRGVTWIHAHFGDRKLLVAWMSAMLVGKPYSLTVHAHELYSAAKAEARRRAISQAEYVFTVSDFTTEVLQRDWAIPASKIIMNRLILGNRHLNPDSRPRMLVVGNFVEKKGYDVLLEALRRLEASEIVAWIVGGGPIDVPEMVRSQGLGDRAILFGRVSEPVLNVLLDACDFFCLPSRTSKTGEKEGFPMALGEAMSHSKPILSTRHAGIPEIVPEILVAEGDPAALLAGIREMLARKSEWPSMGARNRALSLQHFSQENTEVLAEIFSQSLRPRSRKKATATSPVPDSRRINIP